MHVVGVVLADITVAVVGQGQLVVLGAVDDLGLQRRVDITKAHGGGGTAQQVHHLHVGGGLLDADLQAFQVRRGVDGGVDRIEVAGAGIQPSDGLEAGLLGGAENRSRDVLVVHGGMVRLTGRKKVRQVEQGIVVAEGFQQRVGRHTEVDGAGLGQLDHLVLGAQQLAGEDLHVIFVAQFALDKFFKRHQRNVGGMVGGLVVANADDLPSVGRSAAASAQRAQHQDRCQSQRHPAECTFHRFALLSPKRVTAGVLQPPSFSGVLAAAHPGLDPGIAREIPLGHNNTLTQNSYNCKAVEWPKKAAIFWRFFKKKSSGSLFFCRFPNPVWGPKSPVSIPPKRGWFGALFTERCLLFSCAPLRQSRRKVYDRKRPIVNLWCPARPTAARGLGAGGLAGGAGAWYSRRQTETRSEEQCAERTGRSPILPPCWRL